MRDGPTAPARRSPSGLTLWQLMKLVAALCAASAVVAPLVRMTLYAGAGWKTAAIFGAMTAPIVLAVVSFPLVRRGPWKDSLIAALLAIPVVLGFGLINAFLCFIVGWGRLFNRGFPLQDLAEFGALAAADVVLGLALIFLARRIIPRRCLRCRRFLLVRDDRPEARRPEPWRPVPYRCLGCEARFLRVFGHWDNLPGDEAAAVGAGPAG